MLETKYTKKLYTAIRKLNLDKEELKGLLNCLYINGCPSEDCARLFGTTEDKIINFLESEKLYGYQACSKCGKLRNRENDFRQKYKSCIICEKKYMKNYMNDYNKKYYKNNRESLIEYRKKYDENNKENQLDHSKLHPFVNSADGNHRDLSATVSAQNEVIKDLVKQIGELKDENEVLKEKLNEIINLLSEKE